jgi:hypothetical protein
LRSASWSMMNSGVPCFWASCLSRDWEIIGGGTVSRIR